MNEPLAGLRDTLLQAAAHLVHAALFLALVLLTLVLLDRNPGKISE